MWTHTNEVMKALMNITGTQEFENMKAKNWPNSILNISKQHWSVSPLGATKHKIDQPVDRSTAF